MADDQVPSGTFNQGTITNSTAETYDGRNSVCQLSGFKAHPDELVRNWNGLWVLPQYRDIRNPQDFLRATTEQQNASPSPEIPRAEEFVIISEILRTEDGGELRSQSGGPLMTESVNETV